MPRPDIDTGAAKSKKADDRLAKGIADMARQLKGGHELASLMTGLKSLTISDEQAVLLADPAYRVCKKYGLSVDMVLGPEVSLLTAMAFVYAPMLRHLKIEIEMKRQEMAQNAGSEAADGTVVYPPQFRQEPATVAPQTPTEERPIVFDQPAGSDGGLADGGFAAE